jgi:hypothetical protein
MDASYIGLFPAFLRGFKKPVAQKLFVRPA